MYYIIAVINGKIISATVKAPNEGDAVAKLSNKYGNIRVFICEPTKTVKGEFIEHPMTLGEAING